MKIVTELISTTPYEEELVETDTLAPGEQKVEQTPVYRLCGQDLPQCVRGRWDCAFLDL